VTERGRVVASAILGAVAGTVVGFILFTDAGRSIRRELEPTLDDLSSELGDLRRTVLKAVNVVAEGWRVWGEALADSGPRGGRYVQHTQSSPY
jgi:hypothetical protein